MTSRQLYSSPLSSNSRRTLLCAAHLGIDLEVIAVNLADPASRETLAKVNPNAKIPVLVEGDFVLWESNAINQYLCDQTPGQTLWPTEPRAKADVNRWLFWQTAHLSPPVGGLNFERMIKRFTGRGEADPAAVAAHEVAFHQFAKVIDGHLARHAWLANDALSIADYSLAATLLHSERAQYPMAPYEHLRGHFARVRDTRAWRATEPPAQS